MSAVLAVRDVGFAYEERPVLSDLNLEFGPGLHFVVGENGVGKTTLFRLILGSLAPARGSVELVTETGERHSGGGIREFAGYLPQTFSFPPRFTAAEFVMYVGWLKGIPRRNLLQSAHSALEMVGLRERAEEKMSRLSGGMVRRVGIAQAMVTSPSVLLLDEPTASLDPAQRIELRSLITRLALDTTVVVSTHQLEDVRHGDHHVVALGRQRVLFDGATTELLAQRRDVAPVEMSDIESAFIALADEA